LGLIVKASKYNFKASATFRTFVGVPFQVKGKFEHLVLGLRNCYLQLFTPTLVTGLFQSSHWMPITVS